MVKTTPWKWDKVDSDYWNTPAEDVYYFLHRWKNFHKLLDLGCGIGRHSVLFAEHGFDVTAFDLSEEGLEKIREKGLPIRTVLGDVVRLPFEDDEFDCILAYHSMYHVDSAGMMKAINEIKRVLKKGGEIFLTLISKQTYSYTACKAIDDNVRMKEEEDGSVLPHYFVDEEDIYRLFSDFEILRLKQVIDINDRKSSWHYYVHMRK